MSQSDFHGCSYEPLPENAPGYAHALAEIASFLKPKPCPFPLQRIGPEADGAYLLPDDLSGVAACFSPGVFNTKYFEDDLALRFGVPSHMCDFTSDAELLATPLMPGLQTFRKLWLDRPGAPDSIDLETWVGECAPAEADLILQMDIEGAEYRNLLSCDARTLRRFRIVALELHDLDRLRDPGVTLGVFRPVFAKLAQHFACVHARANNCAAAVTLPGVALNMPPVLEITLLRTDRMSLGAPRPVMLPHPEDIERNIVNCPPVTLNAHWFDGPRPAPAQIKLLSDQVSWMQAKLDLELRAQREALMSAAEWLVKATALPAAPSRFDASRLEEVAAGKSFRLNHSYFLGGEEGQVHENDTGYFFHTALASNPAIRIDLGETRVVRRLHVRNRLDGCPERAGLLFAALSLSPEPGSGAVVLIPTPPAFLDGAQPETSVELAGVPARYVTIVAPLAPALHLSRVQVFAEAAAPRALAG